MLGSIKSWKAEQGYGFLKPDEANQPDVFLHITALHKAQIHLVPKPGDRFAFEVGQGKKGKMQAINVVKV